ncbi:MAG: hypothetical protein L6R38_002608 [Xanthoria sp. 2 TBL-2021]|nr:MAG: hypothetical protein L6R38_002608 [Xanthoria sp. 2 TBL-2021]
MTSNPNFDRLDANVKKLEENDEDLRQLAEDYSHSEPASRSRWLLSDETFTSRQTERKEAVATLKALQPKWEAGLSAHAAATIALEAQSESLRQDQAALQAQRKSLRKESDESQAQRETMRKLLEDYEEDL